MSIAVLKGCDVFTCTVTLFAKDTTAILVFKSSVSSNNVFTKDIAAAFALDNLSPRILPDLSITSTISEVLGTSTPVKVKSILHLFESTVSVICLSIVKEPGFGEIILLSSTPFKIPIPKDISLLPIGTILLGNGPNSPSAYSINSGESISSGPDNPSGFSPIKNSIP